LFDAKGLIYMNYIPMGKTVNAEYFKKALTRFLKDFREIMLIMLSQEWILHCDNSPVHAAPSVQNYPVAKRVQTIRHPPYMLDLATGDFSSSQG
jgi:hypothetical protein